MTHLDRDDNAQTEENHIFLLDEDPVSRSNLSFLLKLKNYLVEGFDDTEVAFNRLGQVHGSECSPFCMVINHGKQDNGIHLFLKSLDEHSLGLPILIVDAERLNLRSIDFCQDLSSDFPLFVCRPVEIVEVVSKLHLLKSRNKKR